jgi:hypothetical protein
MGKNLGGHEWWDVTGSDKNIKNIANHFQYASIFYVIASAHKLHVWLHPGEERWLKKISKDYNSKYKLMEVEPQYQTTRCGKNHIDAGAHQRACKSCKRVAEIQDKPKEEEVDTSPIDEVPVFRNKNKGFAATGQDTITTGAIRAAERKEWEKRNGPITVITEASPAESLTYNELAREYRIKADQLMAEAEHYSQIADQYEALLAPTPAVQAAEEAARKAEAALAEAMASADEERQQQRDELEALVTGGPPKDVT